MPDKVLTLKDMTRGSGCTPRTVRYYERQGLLRALRSAGGHRLFAASELERLSFIICLREAGWTLEEVVELLNVRDQAPSDGEACSRLASALGERIEQLARKIELLSRLRHELTNTSTLLAVCQDCTGNRPAGSSRPGCEDCERVPALPELPRAFRLIWRARELEGADLYDKDGDKYDEIGADGAELDDDDLDDDRPEATGTER